MPIRVFPPHYQLVYISFDISSFSLISYERTLVPSWAYKLPFTRRTHHIAFWEAKSGNIITRIKDFKQLKINENKAWSSRKKEALLPTARLCRQSALKIILHLCLSTSTQTKQKWTKIYPIQESRITAFSVSLLAHKQQVFFNKVEWNTNINANISYWPLLQSSESCL